MKLQVASRLNAGPKASSTRHSQSGTTLEAHGLSHSRALRRLGLTLGSAVPYNQGIRTAEFSGRSMCASCILSNPQFSGSPAVRSSTAFAAGTSEEFPGAVQGATPTQ